jgi:large subunit ribosomal protein L4
VATVDVFTTGSGKAGSVELELGVFEAPVKEHLFHAEVRRQLSRRRAGTHSTKNRAGVSGGGAKPYRQKGTGRARQGTTRAPQYAGGGRVFGPVPRGYEHKLPKRVRRAALRSALSARYRDGGVAVVDSLDLGEFKTRRLLEALDGLGIGSDSVLIVIEAPDPHVERSARNLPRVGVVRAEGLNVYDVLRHDKLLVTRGALEAIHVRLREGGGGEGS